MGHVAQVQAGFMRLELEREDSVMYFSLRHKHIGKQGSSPWGFLRQWQSCPWGPTGMSLLGRHRTWQRGFHSDLSVCKSTADQPPSLTLPGLAGGCMFC